MTVNRHCCPSAAAGQHCQDPECACCADDCGCLDLSRKPLQATTHLPGSAGKMRVMMERARRGESLFHPDDAKTPLAHRVPDAA
jgi:hypothetical protein